VERPGLLRAQVVYRQGVVKDFLCYDDLTLAEFVRRASAFGKVRLLRSLRPVRDLHAEIGGGAVAWLRAADEKQTPLNTPRSAE
jgi:hypothetical protein